MRRLVLAVGLAACVLVPSSLFLGRYVVSGTGVVPAGSDTSQHVWRSHVVAGLGLEALPAFEGRSQALNTNADRPGLPIVLSFLSAVTGAEARDLAYVFPSVAAAAIALAAAALAGAIPGVPGWGIGVVGRGDRGLGARRARRERLPGSAPGRADVAAGRRLRAPRGRRGPRAGARCRRAPRGVAGPLAVRAPLHGAPGCARARVPAGLAPRSPAGTPAGRDPLRSRGDDHRGRRRPRDRRAPSGNAGDPARTHRTLAQLGGSAPFGPTRPLSAAGSGDRGGGGRCLAGRRHSHGVGPPGSSSRGRWCRRPRRSCYAAGRTVPLQRALSFALAIPVLGAIGLVAAILWMRGRFGKVAAAAVALVAFTALIPFGLVRMGNVAHEEAVERGPRARRVPRVGQLPGRSRPPRDRRGGRGTEGGERHGRRVRDRAGDAADPGRSAGPSRTAHDRLPRRPRPPRSKGVPPCVRRFPASTRSPGKPGARPAPCCRTIRPS